MLREAWWNRRFADRESGEGLEGETERWKRMCGKEIVFLSRGYEGETNHVCRSDEGERELVVLKVVIARKLLCECAHCV